MASRAWLAATVLAACSAAALADGNLTASGYDVDGNMFKEAGLTRKFDPKDKSYIMHLIWIAMPGIVIAFGSLCVSVAIFGGNVVCKCWKLPAQLDVPVEVAASHRRCPTVILAFASIFMIGATVVAWMASMHVEASAQSALGHITQGVLKYHGVVNDAKNSYRAFNPNPMLPLNVSVNGTYTMTKTADAALRGLDGNMVQLSAFLAATQKVAPAYTAGYAWGFRACLLLATLATVMAFGGAMLGRGKSSQRAAQKCVGFCSWVSLVVLVLLWVVFALHLDFAAVVTDSCPMMNDQVLELSSKKQLNPGAASSDLRYLLTCLGAGDTTLVTALNEAKGEYHLGMEELMQRGADGGDISEAALDNKHKEMARLGLHTERLKGVVEGLEAASDCRNLQPYYVKGIAYICDTGYTYIVWIIIITCAMGFVLMSVSYSAFRLRRLLLESAPPEGGYKELESGKGEDMVGLLASH